MQPTDVITTKSGLTATLYLADCLEVLPTLGKVDAVITDPPYGIGYEASRYQHARHTGVMQGDNTTFDSRPLLALGVPMILWGANNYTTHLPRGGWLVWDKRTNEAADKILGSPFELAWHHNPTRFKILRLQHGGAKNADGEGLVREHPTQKPIRLMQWSIEQACGVVPMVLDCHQRSGTNGEMQAVQEGFHKQEAPGGDVLFTDMLKPLDSAAKGEQPGLRGQREGLQASAPPRPSDGVKRGLRDGAPAGDGRALGADAATVRSGAPPERRQAGQPRGEPRSASQAQARQVTQAAGQADSLPPLREDDPRVWAGAPRQPLVIFDPYMGSGTTGVAALRMGCSFIGIEISDKYYQIAKRRIAAEAAQGKLF